MAAEMLNGVPPVLCAEPRWSRVAGRRTKEDSTGIREPEMNRERLRASSPQSGSGPRPLRAAQGLVPSERLRASSPQSGSGPRPLRAAQGLVPSERRATSPQSGSGPRPLRAAQGLVPSERLRASSPQSGSGPRPPQTGGPRPHVTLPLRLKRLMGRRVPQGPGGGRTSSFMSC
ncbi:hypothetical protein NHX12_022301 [Muraenolepis orangiensis]|uniref:Uncharacterized protein n=1 Tax=Muraenolepis orangiensis TaxID=630683 RepID=A0A9Q0EMA6_9TELE|nr:hypothetical protein NHX12_022301 [Muraenolepis orangiensis]